MTFTFLTLLRYLEELTASANAYAPDDYAAIEEFGALCKRARETDKNEVPTRAARAAQRKLRSPKMVSTRWDRGIPKW